MTVRQGLLFSAGFVVAVFAVVWAAAGPLCVHPSELGCGADLAVLLATAHVVLLAPLAASALFREAGRVVRDGRAGIRLAACLGVIAGVLAVGWLLLGSGAVLGTYLVALPVMTRVGRALEIPTDPLAGELEAWRVRRR